jgi:hypothetical protein
VIIYTYIVTAEIDSDLLGVYSDRRFLLDGDLDDATYVGGGDAAAALELVVRLLDDDLRPSY